MTGFRCKFSPSDRHQELIQLCWKNMWVYLTNVTTNRRKKLIMHLKLSDLQCLWLKYPPPCLFFPDLVTWSWPFKPVSTARGLSATQPKACVRSLTTQKPKRLPRVNIQTQATTIPETKLASGKSGNIQGIAPYTQWYSMNNVHQKGSIQWYNMN